MKVIVFLVCFIFFSICVFSQEKDPFLSGLHFKHGIINLGKNIGKINVQKGYKFLDANQSRNMFTKYLQIPESKGMTLGMIFKERKHKKASASEMYGFSDEDEPFYLINIQYAEIGYVKEDFPLAEKVELHLTSYPNNQENSDYFVWLARPVYDKKNHILFWAKAEASAVLGTYFDIVYLGRKGILILNVIAIGEDLDLLGRELSDYKKFFQFSRKNMYIRFRPSIDRYSAFQSMEDIVHKVEAYSPLY